MSISYSGIVGRGGNMTLPSVEAGLGSMNILRDPPRSIMTRRIDKVGETSSITEMQDMAADRICESIKHYARGVNPMVSVSYSNYGNNGGQRVNGFSNSTSNNGQQAYLPYTIMKDGAFRPPIVAPESLLPLSRQPRMNTQAFTQPCFVDYTKKMYCPGSDYGTKETIKACIRPTATYKIVAPLVEPFEVKYVIQNPIKVSANSGIRTLNITQQHVAVPTKEIENNPVYVNPNVNMGTIHQTKYVDTSNLDTERYLQNTLHSSVQSKHSRSIQVTPIEDIMDINIKTKDAMNISYTAPISGNTKNNYIHKDIELKRRVVQASANTNKQRNIYSRPEVRHMKQQSLNRPNIRAFSNHGTVGRQSGIDHNNRNYRLNPTISAGGFEGRSNLPMANRMQNVNENYESEHMQINRKVMSMHEGRYLN